MLDLHKARSLNVQLARTIKFTGIVGFVFSLGLILEPSSPFRWGLVIGTVVGVVNSVLIYNRMKHIADMPFEKAVAFMRMGFFMRLLMIMAVLFLAIRFDALDIYGVAFGIFVAPMITMIDFNISLLNDYKAYLVLKNKN
ncbi:putative membrane protein [Desulfohalotomaculum tongense]|uniref:ATP synthase subunit I n=1 Tax=Desulforadius tongensis TaxID=1216062 RepID=UPI001959E5C8|nr:ATP synthase subunit I [Desulforadius tongensis]MBM7853737.1 putative membrane protein [Desulforadius tongensis]